MVVSQTWTRRRRRVDHGERAGTRLCIVICLLELCNRLATRTRQLFTGHIGGVMGHLVGLQLIELPNTKGRMPTVLQLSTSEVQMWKLWRLQRV